MAKFWQWQGDTNTGSGLVSFTGSATVIISGTATTAISGTSTVTVSGTTTVNFSAIGTVSINGNFATNNTTIYTATVTWTSGTTATSSQTITISALGTTTTVAHEIFITNDGPYEITADIYKIISAGATVNVNVSTALAVPITAATAGVTIGGKGIAVQGLFNVNLGLIIRLTVTAAFTAAVTNSVIIKELDL